MASTARPQVEAPIYAHPRVVLGVPMVMIFQNTGSFDVSKTALERPLAFFLPICATSNELRTLFVNTLYMYVAFKIQCATTYGYEIDTVFVVVSNIFSVLLGNIQSVKSSLVLFVEKKLSDTNSFC